MATPQINDINIPQPSAASPPSFEEAYRGTGREMADGTAIFDWVSATRKRVWKLSWQAITSANVEILRTAYNTVATGTSTKWEPTEGGTYYVTLDPKNIIFSVEIVSAAGATLLYNVKFNLREV